MLLPCAVALQFFAQGDLELANGIPISPLMDRQKEGVSKSQPGVSPGRGAWPEQGVSICVVIAE